MTGWFNLMFPVDPKNGALKSNTPPSEATSRYPLPSDTGAMPTTGLFNLMPPVDP